MTSLTEKILLTGIIAPNPSICGYHRSHVKCVLALSGLSSMTLWETELQSHQAQGILHNPWCTGQVVVEDLLRVDVNGSSRE